MLGGETELGQSAYLTREVQPPDEGAGRVEKPLVLHGGQGKPGESEDLVRTSNRSSAAKRAWPTRSYGWSDHISRLKTLRVTTEG